MAVYDFFNQDAKAAAAKAANEERKKKKFQNFTGPWKFPPVKPKTSIRGRAKKMYEIFSNDPAYLRTRIEEAKVKMASSFRMSKEELPLLVREYHEVSDPCFIDEYEVNTISVKLLKEQIEGIKERINQRTNKLGDVTITTSTSEIEEQLDYMSLSGSGNFPGIKVHATVEFESLKDVKETLGEIRQNEADKKELDKKVELMTKLQKEIDNRVGYYTEVVKSGGEAFYLISLVKDELAKRIKEERWNIAQYPKVDLDKTVTFPRQRFIPRRPKFIRARKGRGGLSFRPPFRRAPYYRNYNSKQ